MTSAPRTDPGGLPEARPDQPAWLDPELATLTQERFSDPAWIFERKLDGERCLAFRAGPQVRLMTRNQKKDTSTYPEIADALAAQQADDFIVEGEIVAFEDSQTRFSRLQQRLGVRHPEPALLAEVPAYFYLFDMLWADGRDIRPQSLRERKRLLRGLLTFDDPLRFTGHRDTDGEAYYREACTRGWEGVIAKRADAPYRGSRTRDWLKFKCENSQDNQRTLDSLHATLAVLERDRPPFDRGDLPRSRVHWVEPRLVAQVGFSEWTTNGELRHPRFQGLRRDKDPADVVREMP